MSKMRGPLDFEIGKKSVAGICFCLGVIVGILLFAWIGW